MTTGFYTLRSRRGWWIILAEGLIDHSIEAKEVLGAILVGFLVVCGLHWHRFGDVSSLILGPLGGSFGLSLEIHPCIPRGIPTEYFLSLGIPGGPWGHPIVDTRGSGSRCVFDADSKSACRPLSETKYV